MNKPIDEFQRVRPRLFAIGYRMLASVQEAEDLVQDVWLRFHENGGSSQAAVLNFEAWLVTMTTRMAIDRLRAARVRRESYPGFWLPEPLSEDGPATPEQLNELSDDVSVAFLVLLDRLSPDARAAFLLREVFDADYDQVAEVLGKSEAAARQIVHRAKRELEKDRGGTWSVQGHRARPEKQQQVLRDFAEALSGAISQLSRHFSATRRKFSAMVEALFPALAMCCRVHIVWLLSTLHRIAITAAQ